MCSKGARRMLIIADTEWYQGNCSSNPIVPRIAILDKDGNHLPDLTIELLNQPKNYEWNKNSIGVWIGKQENDSIKQIERMGASINIFLKNGLSGMWSKFWMIKVEHCNRENNTNNECMWCEKKNLEFIDGHPNGWLEGANAPDLKPYSWEEDIEVIQEPETSKFGKRAKDVDVIVEKEVDSEMTESEDQDPKKYKYKDITWPLTMEEYKDIKYDADKKKLVSTKYPDL